MPTPTHIQETKIINTIIIFFLENGFLIFFNFVLLKLLRFFIFGFNFTVNAFEKPNVITANISRLCKILYLLLKINHEKNEKIQSTDKTNIAHANKNTNKYIQY
jgi:hypothetical protein